MCVPINDLVYDIKSDVCILVYRKSEGARERERECVSERDREGLVLIKLRQYVFVCIYNVKQHW